MSPCKIVLIGAASASFGPRMIGDAMLTPEVRGSTLCLVDIDVARLEVVAAYARRLNASLDAGLTIEHTPDREAALPGADYVITSVAVKRDELWKLDFEIPLKHGIKQVLGENGGPGGLSHALRNIPIILDIAHDMERLCPDAMLLNFSNPESRISLAISRYTKLRFAGLCHGIGMAYTATARITGLPADDLVAVAAGLNHFVWVLDIRRKSTGEDVYPLLRAADQSYDSGYQPLSRRMLRDFGLFPHPSDDHIGEYLPFAWEYCGLEGYDFAAADADRARAWAQLEAMASGQAPLPAPNAADGRPLLQPSGEFAFPIIASQLASRSDLIEAVNIRNDGLIAGLPDWAIVEVPAVASRAGLRGVQVGALPPGITALLNTQAHVQDLAVEAAVHGSRRLALQALLADPVVHSARAAEACLDELLATHRPYLPRFA
jgi:alpha-galactosidase